MSASKTVIISCAGMGKRLGLGTSKCLVDVDGEPLIARNLRMLDGVDDVRVVVGFQAERVIEAVTALRRDVTFVFNHDYARTNTGDSVRLAAEHANEYVLTIDGDLLVHPDDMRAMLAAEGEFVGVTAPGTDDPVLCEVDGGDVVGFSRERGSFEWTGVAQMRAEKLLGGSGHTYQLVEPHLPVPYRYLRTREIDTPGDYERAVRWVRGGCSDEVVVGIVGGMGSYATVGFFKRLVDAFPAHYEWERPRVLIDNRCTMPSRVRAALYGERRDELVRQLAESVRNLVSGGGDPRVPGLQHLARVP
jgi:choline kinase